MEFCTYDGVNLVLPDMAGTFAVSQRSESIMRACSDPLDDVAVKRSVHTRLGGIRIAHMDVHDGGARVGRIDPPA